MPAKSKAQQKAAGMALAAKRGEINPSELRGAARQMYDSMTEEELEALASTGIEELPTKLSEKGDRAEGADKVPEAPLEIAGQQSLSKAVRKPRKKAAKKARRKTAKKAGKKTAKKGTKSGTRTRTRNKTKKRRK